MNDKSSRKFPEHTRSLKSAPAASGSATAAPEPLPTPVVKHDWHRILLYAAIIVATGLFVASPAFHGTWLWDDDQEITANPALSSGLAGLKIIWKGDVGADYLPLKATILWLEWQLWQYDNSCYHIINSIWHVINALLVWQLLSLLRIRWAWIGGLLFAIHPVLVESVAWVSEQKNTISLIFMLLSAITFIKYHEGGKTGNLVASLVLFAAALLSKSAVIVLPFAFVLYKWWKDDNLELRDTPVFMALASFCAAVACGTIVAMRWLVGAETISSQANSTSSLIKEIIAPSGSLKFAAGMLVALGITWGLVQLWNKRKGPQWRSVRHLVLSTAPFFAMAIIVALVTVYFQHKNAIGAEVIPVGGWWSRIVIAGAAIFFYLKQCVWPFDPYPLMPIYPRWEVPENPPLWMFLPWVAFIALVVLFWVYRKTWGKHLILGLGFFFGFLVPVLGFVDMSYMRITWVADHFLYISVIGVIGLMIAGAAKLYDCVSDKGKPWAMGAGIAALVLVAFNGNLYSDVFLNETNMWRYTLSKNPDAWQAHSRYGKVLLDSGNRDAAYYHIQQSNRLRPDLAETNNNMGVLLLQKGRNAEALPYFRRAMRLMPIGAFMVNYANALTQVQQGAEAAPVYEKIFRAESGPKFTQMLRERGYQTLQQLLSEQGNVTIGDLVNSPDGAALGKLLKTKCGDSHERVLGLKGGAAIEELIKLRVSDPLDDLRKARTVDTLENLVKEESGAALEKRLAEKGILNDLLKLDAAGEFRNIFTLKGSAAYLALRKMRGSDAYESMILDMRDEPLAHLLEMRGGDLFAKLIKADQREALSLLRQMNGTEVFDVVCEMMGGDPMTRLLSLDGGNAILLTNYGVALMQANRRDDAILALQKALRINPNLADARRNLEVALGKAQPQPAQQQDLRFPMSNVPGSAGVPLQIPSIFLNK
ncbi:tetratricopeptide (TPR) repeat protein [Ereboglobus sp. PH5-5]|uniref:glycosyltransferase family 39 protein n=1 Tax=Ereboglobus sp. PH5-5 TaxID=2940529 RepID=UPI002406FE29|nr:tetratricopeptide repeat protein [Ereboglobus sp. PH5-5]MDF9832064.1 tetratricopeptide (TPR) repeat protein [Ereboglobus sp. PH5-5]